MLKRSGYSCVFLCSVSLIDLSHFQCCRKIRTPEHWNCLHPKQLSTQQEVLLGHLYRQSWAPFRCICATCETPLLSTVCPGLTNRMTRENLDLCSVCSQPCLWLTQTTPSQGIGLDSRTGWFPAAHIDSSGSSDGKVPCNRELSWFS